VGNPEKPNGIRLPLQWWRRVSPQRKIFLVLASIFLGVFLYFQVPWEQAYREGAVRVMQAELAALPSVDGAAELSQTKTVSATSPSLSVTYPQSGPCAAVQDHYRQVAPAAGWASGGVDVNDPKLERAYHKVAGGYYLTLVVVCAEGTDTAAPAGGAHCGLLFSVPSPYSLSIFGPWLPRP